MRFCLEQPGPRPAPCSASPRSVALQQRQPCGLPARRLTPFAAPVASRAPALRLRTAAAATSGTLISKTEIPAFIPRDDLVDQLVRWAGVIEGTEAVANFGMPIKVEEVFREDDGRLWGAHLTFMRDGQPATKLYFGFDNLIVEKHEWLGMDDQGFPVNEGKKTDVDGANFEIRKVCDSVVDDELRQSIRDFCKTLVSTINKYYAFGSVFVDEAT